MTVQQKLAEYRRQGAHVVTMEVSSHSPHQGRVNGVDFATAVLTNLTRDHLDYHGSMEAYGESKKKLFFWEGLQHAVINADDAFGRQLAAEIDPAQTQVVTYGLEQGDVRPLALAATLDGLQLTVTTPWASPMCAPAWWAASTPPICWPVWPRCASTASACATPPR